MPIRYSNSLLVLVLGAALSCGCSNLPSPTPARPPAAENTPIPPIRSTLRPPATPTPAPTVSLSDTIRAEGGRPAASSTPFETPGVTPPPLGSPSPLPTGSAAATVAPEPVDALQIDGRRGRLYLPVRAEDGIHTLVFAAEDGRRLPEEEQLGMPALDPARRRLILDQGDAGLAILSLDQGTLQQRIDLPGESLSPQPAPLILTESGRLLAFRGPQMLEGDPASGRVAPILHTAVTRDGGDCRSDEEPLPIVDALLDETQGILYLSYLTYVCTPWIGYTFVAFDSESGAELGQHGALPFSADVSGGVLYGASWRRFGSGSRWAWQPSKAAMESSDWLGAGRLFADAPRRRLYQTPLAGLLHVLDAESMTLQFTLECPGQMVGFDQADGRLYFLPADAGRLIGLSVDAVQPPAAGVPFAVEPPALPVRDLMVTADGTLWGIWSTALDDGRCSVFNQNGGLLLRRAGDDAAWQSAGAGLPPICANVMTLVAAPDGTLFAGVAGQGVFLSRDGGRLWAPSSAGLSSMGVQQLTLSEPADGGEPTLFALLQDSALFRSDDAGRQWRRVRAPPIRPVAISPDFSQDLTLMGSQYASDGSGPKLIISRDAGEQWMEAGPLPAQSLSWLALAPLFARWNIAFAYDGETLYRTADSGQSWQAVWTAEKPFLAPAEGQIIFAPDSEERRSVFLLLRAPLDLPNTSGTWGKLMRSRDGGQNWEEIGLPEGQLPMALALAPAFAAQRQIYVGAQSGQVLRLAVD